MMGGRRRRTSKRKTMKGGNMYGFGVDQGIGSAGAARPAVANPAVNSATGAAIPEYTMPGGRRRRKTRKSRKVTRKSRRRRTMRGGASYVGSANSGATFGGQGIGGMANYGSYNSNTSGPGNSHTQTNGVWSV
jgi:hypothetical protein